MTPNTSWSNPSNYDFIRNDYIVRDILFFPFSMPRIAKKEDRDWTCDQVVWSTIEGVFHRYLLPTWNSFGIGARHVANPIGVL